MEEECPGGTFAGLPVGDGLGQVSVVTLLAVVAVASSCVVTAVETDASAFPPRQLVQLHVEATPPGVKVAVTRWGQRGAKGDCNALEISLILRQNI